VIRLYTVSTPRNSLTFLDRMGALAAIARIRREDARWPLSTPTRVTLTSAIGDPETAIDMW
jgi:hypothetical protein